MQEVAKHIPDVTTFAANLVVFFAAIAAAVAGSLAGVKKIKSSLADLSSPATPAPGHGDIVTQQRLVGTLMMETLTAKALSDSNTLLAAAVDDLTDVTRDSREATCDLTREVRELRHQVERLTDRMK